MSRLKPVLMVLLSALIFACGGEQPTDYYGLKFEATGQAGYNKSRMDAVESTSDGGKIVAGRYNEDLWLMKFNADGSVAWQNTYLPIFSVYRGLVVLDDGSYVVAGLTQGTGLTFVMGVEANGEVRFLKTYSDAFFFKAFKSFGNRLYLLGEHGTQAALMQLDKLGNVISTSTYASLETLEAITILPNGELIVAGNRGNANSAEGRIELGILKLSSQGQVINTKFYTKENTSIHLAGVYLDNRNRVVVAGTLRDGIFSDSNYFERPFKLSVATDLETVEIKSYTFNKWASIYDILFASDGGMVMVGEFGTNNFDFSQTRAAMVKLNENGTIAWKKRYKFPQSFGETPADLTESSEGYLFVGSYYTSNTDYGFLVSTDRNGGAEGSVLQIDDIPNGQVNNVLLDEYSPTVTRQTKSVVATTNSSSVTVWPTYTLTRY